MFDPRDYDGDTPEHDEAERRERLEIQMRQDEERTAREWVFRETNACELDCYETLAHTVGCQRFSSLMEERIARAHAAIASNARQAA